MPAKGHALSWRNGPPPTRVGKLLPDLLARVASAADQLVRAATAAIAPRVLVRGRLDRLALDREQHAVHGLAWYATYAAVLEQLARWSARLFACGRMRPIDELLARVLAAEYAEQLAGGIPMGQQEIIRPQHMGVDGATLSHFTSGSWWHELNASIGPDERMRAAELVLDSRSRATLESVALDEELDLMRDEFRAFADEKVIPFAQVWHSTDALIPMEVIAQLSELGVFGLTIPESHGGAGLGKLAMCVVSEELSRGYIGVGSLGTRAEIAAELILNAGTPAQRDHWLPRIASGKTIVTAAFTEPDAGSDLAAVRARARRDCDWYVITGSKTWTTHAARADLMTLLVRTDPNLPGHRGLSILLAPKTPARADCDFPDEGLNGSEIPVLGYRGMKEYALSFDAFRVPADALLGEVEGLGFGQLMATFESARIQTAARAIGLGQSALELGLDYAVQRQQFGQSLYAYPRVRNKVLMTAAELLGARQLTYRAAQLKDSGKRCDREAGMAKLLAARIAWSAADGALQIHGGNGFALEHPISRVLCDARVLSIFEGASEIQAQVIARRLIEESMTS
jgi:(2S)-methylsuccinyl-CoA dehydrogenase